MRNFTVNRFEGLDLRPGRYGESNFTLSAATNLTVKTGGFLLRRPALVKVTDLHEESVGLYARGGVLRSVVPGGHSIQDLHPPEVLYDPIGNASGVQLDATKSFLVTVTQSVFTTTIVWSAAFTTESIRVYINGVRLDPGDGVTDGFAISNSGGFLRVTLVTARSASDTVRVDSYTIASGLAYPLGIIDSIPHADTFGTDPIFGPNGYVVVKRTDDLIEHHWLKAPPVLSSTPVSTIVDLGFAPGESLVKMEAKFWATTAVEGTVRFSSVLSPDNWTELNDAGFIPVNSHISGSRFMQMVHHYRGRLAVFFNDAVQLWEVDADPERIGLQQVMEGPGIFKTNAIANSGGDLLYLSRGGFRRMSTVVVTGNADASDFGYKIESLTEAFTDDDSMVAIWSEKRSQFIFVVNTSVFAWTWIESEKRMDWTTWELPIALEYLVELDNVLYARAGDVLYKFDDTATSDYDGRTITTTMRTNALSLGFPGKLKTIHYLTIRQTTAASWKLIVDGVELTARNIPACSPKSLRVPFSGECRQLQIEVTSTANWQLEGLSIDFEEQEF